MWFIDHVVLFQCKFMCMPKKNLSLHTKGGSFLLIKTLLDDCHCNDSKKKLPTGCFGYFAWDCWNCLMSLYELCVACSIFIHYHSRCFFSELLYLRPIFFLTIHSPCFRWAMLLVNYGWTIHCGCYVLFLLLWYHNQ